jgi:anaerobic magnesium-protoporphyrin IX monomethyl ester cyclase
MKILFVTPPSDVPAAIDEQYEPMGILSLAALLRPQGHEVRIVDAVIGAMDREEQVLEAMAPHLDADIVGFAVVGDNQVYTTKRLIARLRGNGYGGFICLGGPAATFLTTEIYEMDDAPDVIVRGESDITFPELVRRIETGKDWHDLPGLAYKGATGDIILNPQPPLIQDLDALPWPERDFTPDVVRLGNPVSLITSRGCWAKCTFCSTPEFYSGLSGGKPWRCRSAASVLREVEQIVQRSDVRRFRIFDDVFIGSGRRGRERVMEIAEGFSRIGGLSFYCMTRAPEVDRDLFAALKAAGLWSVCIGAESFSKAHLKILQKGCTVDLNRRAYEILKDLAIPEIRLGAILFDPDVTMVEIRENLDFYESIGYLNPIKAYNRMMVSHATPIYRRLKKEGRLQGHWRHYDYDFKEDRVAAMYRVVSSVIPPYSKLDSRLSELKRYHHRDLRFMDCCIRLDSKVGARVLEIMLHIASVVEAEVPPKPETADALIRELRPQVEQDVRNFHRQIDALEGLRRTIENAAHDRAPAYA